MHSFTKAACRYAVFISLCARLRFLRPTLSPSEVKPKDCNAEIYRRPKCPRY